MFTPGGFVTFVGHLVPTFWRGELVWETRTLASPLVDALYLVTTLVFLTLAAVGLRRRERAFDARVAEVELQRRVARLTAGDLEDPEIDRVLKVEGAVPGITVGDDG